MENLSLHLKYNEQIYTVTNSFLKCFSCIGWLFRNMQQFQLKYEV